MYSFFVIDISKLADSCFSAFNNNLFACIGEFFCMMLISLAFILAMSPSTVWYCFEFLCLTCEDVSRIRMSVCVRLDAIAVFKRAATYHQPLLLLLLLL
jgi:hypothetical protein